MMILTRCCVATRRNGVGVLATAAAGGSLRRIPTTKYRRRRCLLVSLSLSSARHYPWWTKGTRTETAAALSAFCSRRTPTAAFKNSKRSSSSSKRSSSVSGENNTLRSCRSQQQTAAERNMTHDALALFRAAVQAVDPAHAIQHALQLLVEEGNTDHDDHDYGSITTTTTRKGLLRVRNVNTINTNHNQNAEEERIYRLRFRHVKNNSDLNLIEEENSNEKDDSYNRVILVGFGKASAAMACSVLQVLDPLLLSVHSKSSSGSLSSSSNQQDQEHCCIISGRIIVKDGHFTPAQVAWLHKHNVQVKEAAHPIPDARNVEASMELLDCVVAASAAAEKKKKKKKYDDIDRTRTLVICCISGGGSALFCAPHPSLTLTDLQATNRILLESGLSIQEINTIRKQLELGKGGKFARAAIFGRTGDGTGTGNGKNNDKRIADSPVHVLSLILSDVIGDPLDLIASGPTVRDNNPMKRGARGFQRHLEQLRLPKPVMELLQKQNAEDNDPENNGIIMIDNDDDIVFGWDHSHTCLVGNNGAAVWAAAQYATTLGYVPVVLTTQLTGEAREVARVMVAMAQHIQASRSCTSNPSSFLSSTLCIVPTLPAALIWGGETTVTLPHGCTGVGGRNQEMALQAALAMNQQHGGSGGLRNVVVACLGTDGGDGPTDAAGAIVDGATVDRLGIAAAREALHSHNAYPYLSQSDAWGHSPLVKTGPTGTNVADLYMVLIGKDEDAMA